MGARKKVRRLQRRRGYRDFARQRRLTLIIPTAASNTRAFPTMYRSPFPHYLPSVTPTSGTDSGNDMLSTISPTGSSVQRRNSPELHGHRLNLPAMPRLHNVIHVAGLVVFMMCLQLHRIPTGRHIGNE